jgi:integrase
METEEHSRKIDGGLMDATKLKNQLKKFEEYLVVDVGLGVITVAGNCRTVSIALRRMRKFSPKYSDVKAHILWMHSKNYSYSHIVNTSLALEHYTRSKGKAVKIGRPQKPKRLIKGVLSEAEVSRMIQAANGVRQKAIMATLAYSGLRNREICNLKLEDVDLGANQVRVIGGKNKKDRVVNISAECTRVLIDYLRSYPRPNDRFLFTTIVKGRQLATGDLRKIVRIIARRAKIVRRV